MFTNITVASIAKMATRQIIAMNVATLTRKGLEEYTDLDPDSVTVQVGSAVVGQVVAMKAQRYTNDAVDYVAALIAARKEIAEDIATAVEEVEPHTA